MWLAQRPAVGARFRMLDSGPHRRKTVSVRSPPRDDGWLLRSFHRGLTLVRWLFRGDYSRPVEAVRLRLGLVPANEATQSQTKRRQLGRPAKDAAKRADAPSKTKLRKKPAPPTHRNPKIELLDVRRLGSLSVDDMTSVAVVMPCTDAKMGMDTAQLLAKRAGMECRILVVNDTLRQGFVKTLNDTTARMSVRYVVYLAQDAYPGNNWLRDANDALEKSGKGLLGFNDGTFKGRIATFGMVRVDWIRGLYGGPVFHPGYNCHGADNELTVIARATDMYVYDPNCTLVEYDPDKEF